MKKIANVLVKSCLALSLILMASCEDYLERTPESVVSPEVAFKNFVNFQGFTEELYHCVPDFTNAYWTNSWNWGEDEIQSTANSFHYIIKIDNGDFWGWQQQFDGWGAGWMDGNGGNASPTSNDRMQKRMWPLSWYGIRKANMGLENLDKLTDATEEEKNLVKGQLLFFRAWFHFQLMQYFGGLPYIDKVLPGDQPLRMPRLSYHETAERAAQDFREAANLLPINWDNTTAGRRTLGKNTLRINKIMALGYLGKNYLWAGSPLMNKESTGNSVYNQELTQKAAEAFGELLSLVESGQTQYALLPFSNYFNNFYTQGQNWLMPGGTEALFQAPTWGANGSNWNTSKQYQPSPYLTDETIKFLPTSNYVNNYGMANGLPISDITKPDPESGYNPAFPWQGRDPRFYNDIAFDGVKIVQGSLPANLGNNVKPDDVRYASLYTNGAYRNVNSGSRTGYMLYKFIPKSANRYDGGFDYGNSLHIKVPYMRLADIYIMYAEAAAQAYGSSNGKAPNYSKNAVEAINVIRNRAGVGQVAGKFLGSLDAFMGELRRERAVELSYEGHRFNDLRRWLLLIESPYTLKKSVEFDRVGTFDALDPKKNQVANLREQVILERKFTEKHYWLPLKNADVNMYLEFNQNPGW